MSTTVAVICTGPSHEGKTVKVCRFTRADDRWTVAERPRSAKNPPYRFHRGQLVSAPRQPNPSARLEGNEPIGPLNEMSTAARDQVRRAFGQSALRERYKLECRLCGLSATVRAERLAPMLDDLAHTGVSEIELGTLVRVVS